MKYIQPLKLTIQGCMYKYLESKWNVPPWACAKARRKVVRRRAERRPIRLPMNEPGVAYMQRPSQDLPQSHNALLQADRTTFACLDASLRAPLELRLEADMATSSAATIAMRALAALLFVCAPTVGKYTCNVDCNAMA